MVVSAALAFGGVDDCPAQDQLQPVKIVSFNIRYGAANDGENHWNKRKSLVLETIQLASADIVGLQESLDFQGEFLQASLPEFDFVGRSRELDPKQGEYCGIFFNRQRFKKVGEGHFWLSETPDVPASKSWDSSLPRMVSWVRLVDRQSGDREFIFANTHFDHRGKSARAHSARVIQEQLIAKYPDVPIVLTGDFNTAVGSEPYETLVGKSDAQVRPLFDSYRKIHPGRRDDEGTFGGWKNRRKGPRIDWILHSADWTTLDARIIHLNENGRFPSDHFPVEAVLRLGSNKPK